MDTIPAFSPMKSCAPVANARNVPISAIMAGRCLTMLSTAALSVNNDERYECLYFPAKGVEETIIIYGAKQCLHLLKKSKHQWLSLVVALFRLPAWPCAC